MNSETNKKKIKKIINKLVLEKEVGVKTNSLNLTLYLISKATKQTNLFIVGENGHQLYQQFAIATNIKSAYEDALYDKSIYPRELNSNSENEVRRVEGQVARGEGGVIFCSALPEKVSIHVKKTTTQKRVIKTGDKINKKELIETALAMGYSKVDTTRYPGEISTRGGVIDFFSINDNNPTRIDLFGDNIDSIRRYNPTSQLSVKSTDKTTMRSMLKNISPLKTISYKDFLNKYNYKILYVKIKDNKYITSNAEELNDKKLYDIETKALKRKPEKNDKIKLETLRFGGQVKSTIKRDNRGGVGSTKTRFVYEQISNQLILKYLQTPKDVIGWSNNEKAHNVHNYSWGDFITHEDFGVGVFKGIITKRNNDYIKIEYKNNSTVLVSVQKIYKICPYIGVPRPELNSVSNKNWAIKTAKTAASIQKIIDEMVVVNKNRDIVRPNNIKKDSLIEDQVEKNFPYIKTADQITAINDVYKDLGSPGLMDRIIIGDVGFGKTEVALRAAVRSVVSGGFVMIVVPTTILADQHYISLRGRLENVGINVEMISRFVSNKKKKQISKEIVAKTVDILVGTHAILGDDIPKNRLSLVIIDEEHKFGVKHKNQLLKIRKAIDILTLSATPIPRTLQQSLLGIRDVSLIQTPPINRLPIKTRVLYKHWDHIKTLIQKEFLRSGQVYFLHNRVETLPVVFERLRLMFPDVKTAMAHGKMPSRELESVVLSFFSGDVKMLVCTSIVESGLDVSNANTIIINDAHLFGLSQLYQIRGRVGRSMRQAYCYLTIPDVSILSVEAVQRLRAIESSVHLGSGYNIALKDLEIRGSGNLFGYEQSGSVDKVGYHLYCKMFEQALQKNKEGGGLFHSLHINAFFSSSFDVEYMPLSEDRIYYYQRIASTFRIDELDTLEAEVVDRYGRLLDESKNIFILAKVRILYSKTMVTKIDINKNSTVFTLENKNHSSFGLYIDSVFLKLSGSSVRYVFKQPEEDILIVDIEADKFAGPVSVAFNCIDCFIYNKKNS